ncbi:MAG TPA: helix-turn-helix domain-containing protein [Gammaproteobacteria bacterium]
MTARRPNHRLIKTLRTYTVEEAATLFEIHKITVRRWIKEGLPVINDRRPVLILGQVLYDFLRAKRAKRKQPCKSGEIYCVHCRAPKSPALNMADFKPVTQTMGNLTAICPDCDSIMNRRVSTAKLAQIKGKIDITFPQG